MTTTSDDEDNANDKVVARHDYDNYLLYKHSSYRSRTKYKALVRF